MSSPFRIGVAGVGAIGKNHARIMAEIAAKSDGVVAFTAVYDADPARAAEFAAQYGTHAASDLSDFASRVDAATVAVPTIFHRKVAEPLMQAGIHVMVEKPISESYAEAQALIELAKAKSVILQVGHIERFNPVLLQLEQRMDNPRFIEAHRLSPFPNRSIDIGVVLDLMIHDIEIVLHLVKSELIQVDAVGIPVLTRREDIANARLKFANGCIANITASRISPEKMRKIRVFQSSSYLSLDYQEQSGWIYRKDGMQIVREAVEVEKDEPLKLEIAAFVECARHGRRPVVTGQEGAEAVRIALEITDQIEKNAALSAFMNRIFIIAGEVSGDTHAAGLLRELKTLEPDMQVIGLGGPKMREVVGDGVEDWVETAGVVGLWEVVKMYRYFKEKMDAVLDSILGQKPEAVILVDYPGFNLRLASSLRTAGYKGRILYYISPQVWAWKKGRVKTMAKVLDLMICIFPFEKEFYEKSGLRTEFSGHPMVDRVVTLKRDWKREPGLVGWFPGSRLNEVRRLFPIMMDAAKAIRLAVPAARFAVSAANETLASYMRQMADDHGMPEAKRWIETGTVYDLMQRAEAGAVASGTATLEAACFGLPYTLVYNVSWPTYVIGKLVVRIKHLGIVNILAKREVVQELVQSQLNSGTLAKATTELLTSAVKREQLQQDLAQVVATLGRGGAYQRAAQAVHKSLKQA